MPYPEKTNSILAYLYPQNSSDGWRVSRNNQGIYISYWNVSLGAQPTEQEVLDAELPAAKWIKIKELKAEGLRRANLVYDDDDIIFPSVTAIKLLVDIDDTYTRSGAPAARLITVNSLITEFDNAKTVINALPDITPVEAYDVVTDPAWP